MTVIVRPWKLPLVILIFALFFFSVKHPKNFDIFFGEKSSSQKNNKDFSNGINEENKNTLKEIVIEDIENFENDFNNLKNFINIKMIDIDGKEECKINKGIFASDHYAMFCDMEINIKKWENKKNKKMRKIKKCFF